MRGVSLEKFIRVRPERPTQARVRAARTREGFEVSAYSDPHNPEARCCARTCCTTARRCTWARVRRRKVPGVSVRPSGWIWELPFSRSYVKDAYFHVGPPFRIVDWISYPHATKLSRACASPSRRRVSRRFRARFWLNPSSSMAASSSRGRWVSCVQTSGPSVPKGAHRLVLGRDAEAR